jgi:hypothetical protein
VLHMRITFLVGPSVAPHFYNASDDNMSQKEVYGYSVPTFGQDVVFAVNEKVRAEQFRMLSEALKSSKMKEYVPTFVKEARMFFSCWPDLGTIDFKDQFNELILFTASATIMGREVRENMFKEVTHLYEQLDQGVVPCLRCCLCTRFVEFELCNSSVAAETAPFDTVQNDSPQDDSCSCSSHLLPRYLSVWSVEVLRWFRLRFMDRSCCSARARNCDAGMLHG